MSARQEGSRNGALLSKQARVRPEHDIIQVSQALKRAGQVVEHDVLLLLYGALLESTLKP